mmetsp:Transcript_40101/g.103817  ORF Transcript_40101/g.103817 Transcript_40101/m.103817 type:complete len:109 (-) Transcript_40101:921-1247(-)
MLLRKWTAAHCEEVLTKTGFMMADKDPSAREKQEMEGALCDLCHLERVEEDTGESMSSEEALADESIEDAAADAGLRELRLGQMLFPFSRVIDDEEYEKRTKNSKTHE